MNKRNLKNTDWSILIISLVLFAIGIVALYSCTQATEFDEMKKQLIWFVISIPILIIFIVVDYNLISRASYIIYGICILLLIAVLFTPEINGARSWFNIGGFSLQPGEFAKVFVVIFFSTILCKFQEKGKKEINKPWKLIVALMSIVVPVIFIAIQPDIGTAAAFLIATIFILFVAGIDKKYIIVTCILIVILVPIIYMFVLPDHAKTRIDVFLNPNLDPRGSGYNIIQSKLAVGAGKVILYVLLLTKAIHIAKTAKDDLGSYIATGIARSTIFPYIRKYRNDNRIIANNRGSVAFYKLWRKFTYNKFYKYRYIIEY